MKLCNNYSACLFSAGDEPANVVIVLGETQLTVVWNHPRDGPPLTHYQVYYICLNFRATVTSNKQTQMTVDRLNTAAVISDICEQEGSKHIVVVCAVSGSNSACSELVYIEGKCN